MEKHTSTTNRKRHYEDQCQQEMVLLGPGDKNKMMSLSSAHQKKDNDVDIERAKPGEGAT